MSKPLWPAVSGAVARDFEVEVISNNLANVNTNGFKKDGVEFKEYLVRDEKMQDLGAAIPRSPVKDKDLYPLDGRDQSFVIVNGTRTSFKTGGFKVTDNPLDIALNGPGFLEVSTPSGIRYTRAGALKLAPDGRLTTSDGHPVLAKGDANADPASRFINIAGRDGQLHINERGDLYLNDEQVGTLGVVEFGDLKNLHKTGGTLFENKNPKVNPPITAEQTAIRQGVLETSNVNPVEEIANLIRANRMFEQDLKAMKTVSEMLSKESNEIGKMQ
jgi:flagellar basal-body rod protein FlgG